MAFASDVQNIESKLALKFAELRKALAERRAQNKVYRQTVDELRMLSDRDLADLGIHRSMISAIAREAAQAA